MSSNVARSDVTNFCLAQLPSMKLSGSEWRGPCPIHGGKNDSFAIKADTGQWYCHSKCGRGGSFKELLERLGVAPARRPGKRKGTIVAEYDYCDEMGTLLFQNVRYEPKSFSLRRPNHQGGWIDSLGEVRRVLFRLPMLAKSDTVLFAEGEKDVLNLVKLGFVATCNPMGAGKWEPQYSAQLAGKHVVIFPDNDEKGSKHAERVASALVGSAASVRIAQVQEGKDVSEWIARGATRSDIDVAIEKARLVGGSPTDWRTELITNSFGNPKAIFANALTALKRAPDWAGVLAFNEFSQATVALKSPPFATAGIWTDNDDRLTTDWLQRQGITVSVEIAANAVQTVAREHVFHPVRDYLVSLKWDGTPRIDNWLATYLGCELNEYTKGVGSRWLISAVARVLDPGVKADCALILEGPQGLKKSTALRVLGGPWFTDDIADLGSKDAVMQTKGAWIIELAELDSMSRADVSKIKGFMSRTTDRIRPPYGRRLEESPRQCVFAGSVNHGTYLRDETGGRRFWPVQCSSISVDALSQDRDQLWAEAVVRFNADANWWLDTPELIRAAEREQHDRFEADPWQEHIARFVEEKSSVSIDEILDRCLIKLVANWTQADKNRISRILTALGWERKKLGSKSHREWRYIPSRVTQFEAVSQLVSQSESRTGSSEVIDAERLLLRVSQCPSSERAHA